MATAEHITKEQVLYLAKLARLDLTSEEVERFSRELGEILGYVDMLRKLKLETPTGVATAAHLEPRADEIVAWPHPQKLVRLVPARQGDLVTVPPVFGSEETDS